MSNFTKGKLFIIVLLSFLSISSLSQDTSLNSSLNSYFLNGKTLNSSPGVSIAITKNKNLLLIENYGMADIKNKMPISDSSIFDIASLSKQFTAMGILILENQQRISLEDKVKKYIPDLPEIMNEITIYQLLHHTSGIRDWPVLFALKGWNQSDTITSADILRLLKKQQSLNFTAGSEYLYSNSNYNLLAKIIENVTDTNFNIWMQENVFKKANMKNSFFVDDLSYSVKNEVKSYAFSRFTYFKIDNNLEANGSSSLRSNITDMFQWMIYLNKLQSEENAIFKKLTTKGKLNNGDKINYACGLNIIQINNKDVYYHDGAWAGFKTATAYFPESETGIVVLSNNASKRPKKIIKDVSEIVFEKLNLNDSESISKAEEISINDEFFSLCAGKYEQLADRGFFLTFFKKDGEYFVDVNGRQTAKLYAKSDSVFFVKEVDAEFVFHKRNGKVESHTLNQNGNSYKAVKADIKQIREAVDYKKLTGVYYSSELEVEYKVYFKRKTLKIEIPDSPLDISLYHSEDLSFVGNTPLIKQLNFIEENGKIIKFEINTPRAKNIVFNRIE